MEKGLQYLNDLTWGYRASRILQTAIGVGLFTRLSGQCRTCESLAGLCSADLKLLEKVLIACCAMGLLEKKGAGYVNTALSEQYLVEGKPLYQGNIIAHSAGVWEFWNALPGQLATGVTPPLDSAQTHRDFILGMENITMGGRGKLFTDHIDLTGRTQMLDVGGGPGTYSVLACEKYPNLKATVFDLPETIAITRQIISEKGLESQISVQEGNWETDTFGGGYDAVLMSNVLHGAGSSAATKLRKAWDCLDAGGLLVIQEFLLNEDKTGPLIPALFNVMVGAYSQAELFSVVEKAGFATPRLVLQDDAIGCSWVTAEKR
jgi:predicted O-methyltransferase YrrM